MGLHTTFATTSAGSHRLSPQLGEKERAYVFAVAMKYVKDEEAAADVAQDAMLLAHRHRASFRGDARFSTWLYRIAATTALMHLRKRRRRSQEILAMARPGDDAVQVEDRLVDDRTPDTTCADREVMDLVKSRLCQLGDKYERIFWMRYLEGYTETEIASRLDLSLATVKTRAHRARVAVRDHLRAELPAAA